jgi:hypothetical protein
MGAAFVVLFFVVLAFFGVAVYDFLFRGERERWRTLVGAFPFRYDSSAVEPTVNEAELVTAVNRAYQTLAMLGPWERKDIISALSRVCILIVSIPEHCFAPQNSVVQVDFELRLLCHELAHVCEVAIDKKLDRAHARWLYRGLAKAETAYHSAGETAKQPDVL